jgi:thiamine-phosphate pyrophosphorylase
MKYNLLQKLKLCLITNNQGDIINYLKFIEKAAQGGITMVQFRDKKNNNYHDIEKDALLLKNILKPFGIPLIINDFVELAAKINADGVHLGQQDMCVSKARKILGPNKIIGLSIENFEELNKANNEPDISYVTASAVFPSATKTDCKTIWGIDNLTKLAAKSYHPITAIGGINIENAKDVFKAGVCGLAVIGAIHNSKDPYKTAQELIKCANNYCKSHI